MSDLLELELQTFVLLQIGERKFAVPSQRIAELVPLAHVHHFPHQTERVEGVLLRRGRLVPVCDVSEELIGQRLLARRFYLFTLRHFLAGMEPVAIPVTGECELINAEMMPAGADHPPHVQGWISNAGNVIEVLDLDHLIPGPEPSISPLLDATSREVHS
jgi:chemotaxis signal transduction protein